MRALHWLVRRTGIFTPALVLALSAQLAGAAGHYCDDAPDAEHADCMKARVRGDDDCTRIGDDTRRLICWDRLRATQDCANKWRRYGKTEAECLAEVEEDAFAQPSLAPFEEADAFHYCWRKRYEERLFHTAPLDFFDRCISLTRLGYDATVRLHGRLATIHYPSVARVAKTCSGNLPPPIDWFQVFDCYSDLMARVEKVLFYECHEDLLEEAEMNACIEGRF